MPDRAVPTRAPRDEDGLLERNPVPAYESGSAPALLDDFLYVKQTRLTYPAIAGAIQPPTSVLASPSEHPSSP